MKKIIFCTHSGKKIGLGHLFTIYPYIKYLLKSNYKVVVFSSIMNDLNFAFHDLNIDKFVLKGSLKTKFKILKSYIGKNDILFTNYNRTHLFYFGSFFKQFKCQKWIQIDNPISNYAKLSDLTINGLEFVKNFFSLNIEHYSHVSNKYVLISEKKNLSNFNFGLNSNKILVSMGGTDPKNIGIKIVKDLIRNKNSSFSQIIVLKGKNSDWSKFKWSDKVILVDFVDDLKPYLNGVKLVYTTPGLSFFEFLSSSVPIALVGIDEWSSKLGIQLSRYKDVSFYNDEILISNDNKSRPKFSKIEEIMNKQILL